MDSFAIYFFDDVKADQRLIKDYIEPLFDGFSPSRTVSPKIEADIEKFESALLEAQRIDLVILDIIEKQVDAKGDVKLEKAGLKLLNKPLITEKLRSLNTPVLIYSSDDDSILAARQIAQDQGIKVGELRKEFSAKTGAFQTVRKAIEGIVDFGELLGRYKIILTPNLRTLSLNDSVGESVISSILAKYSSFSSTIPENGSITIKALTPGWSGAYIFLADFGASKHVLFKLSNDLQELGKEFKNVEDYYEPLRSKTTVKVGKVSPSKLQYKGWSALSFEFASETNSCFNWLQTNPTDTKVKKNLRTIFSDTCLMGLYKVTGESELDCKSTLDLVLLGLSRNKKLQVKASIEELHGVLLNYNADYENSLLPLVSIIKENGSFDMLANEHMDPGFKAQICHGDLHANNLLIDANDDPILIDAGSIGYGHSTSDVCLLMVDLLIRGIDHGKLAYFDLTAIGEHFKLLEKVIDQKKIDSNTDSNKGICRAINYLNLNVNNLVEIPFEPWEFSLNLAVEFAKAACRNTFPPSKRVVALLAAARAIEEANSRFKSP
ncbi:MAG: phosphotransferase [Flavobacteriales bacterium]|nr:phosphotransferase [Flavobacteriales bacterium]